jgi:hypothetical protein
MHSVAHLRGPFSKFVESPYYSESELCEGAVTVSFSKKYLPWQGTHFLQRSTHFLKTCCRPLITSKFLAWELPFHGGKTQKSQGARSELSSMFGLEKVDRWNPIRTSTIQSRSCPMLQPCEQGLFTHEIKRIEVPFKYHRWTLTWCHANWHFKNRTEC